MTGVLIGRGDLDTEVCREKTTCKHKKKKMIYKSRRETWNRCFPQAPEKKPTLLNLGLGLLTCRNLRKIKFWCFSHPVRCTLLCKPQQTNTGSPMALVVKNRPANAGDARDSGTIPGSGRSPAGGNGNPLQYSCLENSRDRGTWQGVVKGAAKSRIWLSTHTEQTNTCAKEY